MKLDIQPTELRINDDYCWMCLEKGNITKHHALYQYLQPKRNVIIPLCRSCHDKLHGQDTNGLFALAYKINKMQKQMTGKVHGLMKLFGLYKEHNSNDMDRPTHKQRNKHR